MHVWVRNDFETDKIVIKLKATGKDVNLYYIDAEGIDSETFWARCGGFLNNYRQFYGVTHLNIIWHGMEDLKFDASKWQQMKRRLRERYPQLTKSVSCPVLGDYKGQVENMVIHLNDEHNWSREEIADWIDSVVD